MSVIKLYRQAARELTPELFDSGNSLYILEQPADAWAVPANAAAYTVYPRATAAIRDWLIASGDWVGPSPTIVLVERPFNGCDSHGIFLHELSHSLPKPAPRPDVEPSDETRILQDEIFHLFCQPPKIAAPWAGGHDLAFVRRAIHVWHRAINRCKWPSRCEICGCRQSALPTSTPLCSATKRTDCDSRRSRK